MSTGLSFDLPAALEAGEPPEARGVARDGVRMLVARRSTEELVHSTFSMLPVFLAAGDLVVVNTSGTIPAAMDALGADGTRLVVHLSTRLDDGHWVVEPRRPDRPGTRQWSGEAPPARLALGEGAWIELVEPYRGSERLWVARLLLPQPAPAWLAGHARPVRYGYTRQPWPLSAYQNVYATEPGSVEMPSAGRPFTPEVITRLVARGVAVSPLLLHTGLSSPEAHEPPYPERVVVPEATAALVNATRGAGGRVVAVGTTVVRALESAAGEDAVVRPLDGWTELVVTPERGVRAVDALLTGWHEPAASHLVMLEALAGPALVEHSYRAGLAAGYRWHEFGDVHLLLP